MVIRLLIIDILSVNDTSVCLLICVRTVTTTYILLYHLSVRYLEIILVAHIWAKWSEDHCTTLTLVKSF